MANQLERLFNHASNKFELSGVRKSSERIASRIKNLLKTKISSLLFLCIIFPICHILQYLMYASHISFHFFKKNRSTSPVSEFNAAAHSEHWG
mmetsp:Transcript_1924/g.2477  ORF Transcript_1924/g.2477 Transcript_1924/m.2477 type:complete len:93 (-) Transcript_1924:4-282(-)